MFEKSDSRDLKWNVYLLGLLVIVLFSSSIYLDSISRGISQDLMHIAKDLPRGQEDRIRDFAIDLRDPFSNVSMIMQGVAVFLALPFGFLIRLRLQEKNIKMKNPQASFNAADIHETKT